MKKMFESSLADWPTKPGQCLVCGGRGGEPRCAPARPVRCVHCRGTGMDPYRDTDWYKTIVLPRQVRRGDAL